MPSPDNAHPRVLIAEDDDSLRRLLELRIASDGYEVRCAEDGMEALEIVIKGWTPDIVVDSPCAVSFATMPRHRACQSFCSLRAVSTKTFRM
jgi:CheY-like chemotaxis protein